MARYIDAEKLKEKLHIGDELMEKFNVNPAVAQLISIEKDIVMEMEKHIDETPTEDVVGRNSVLEMLSKINNAVEDGDGFQYEEWMEYVNGMEE